MNYVKQTNREKNNKSTYRELGTYMDHIGILNYSANKTKQ